MLGFAFGLIATAAFLAVLCATEFVAPIERHSLRTKAVAIFYSMIHAAVAAGILVLLQLAWPLLGIKPIAEISVSGYTGELFAVGLSLLFFDFLNYWNHRFQHRFLWRIHSLHHCQTKLHAANSYGHFSEKGLRWLLLACPLSLVQFDFPAIPWVILGLREMLELYIHSPTDIHFGWLRNILVDNRYHRIHHSLEQRHFDKNFGVLFSLWDRMFGTAFWPGHDEWPAVGVVDLPPPRSLIETLAYPVWAFRPPEHAQLSWNREGYAMMTASNHRPKPGIHSMDSGDH